MLENKKSVTNAQKLLMIEEFEDCAILSHDRIVLATKRVYDAKWNQLVEKLNSVPDGAKRSVPRWKNVLSDWKIALKRRARSNENAENPVEMDELDQRLFSLMEDEELLQDIDVDLLPDCIAPVLGNENHFIFQPPQLLMFSRRRSRQARAGRQEPYVSQSKRVKSLITIFDNNVDQDGNPHKKIMQMQLDRLHSVSQQLESHIQDVQNRIQRIKDMWQHDCADE